MKRRILNLGIRDYLENINIVIEQCSFSQLKEWEDNGKLILSKEFPEKKKWSDGRRAKLIESILMGIPLAPVFVNSDAKGRFIVLDGYNRLSSVFNFIEDQFSLGILPVLRSYNNNKYSSLPPYLRKKIKDCTIQICVIKPGANEAIVMDILQRVNLRPTSIINIKVTK
jgi:hypothetical protein